MAFFSGVNGSMEIDGVKAAKVAGWELSSSLGMLDATTLQDTDRVGTPAVRSTTGSCTLFYYQPVRGSNAGNDASVLIRKLIKARTQAGEPGQAAEAEEVTFSLKINDSSTSPKHFKVKAYLTSAQMQMAVGEVLSAQVSFEVIGAPVEVAV